MRRLWTRLLLAYLVPVTLVVAAVGWLNIRASRMVLERQLGESLRAAASLAAALLEKSSVFSLQPGDEQSRTYAGACAKLEMVRGAAAASLVFLFDRQGRSLADSARRFGIGHRLSRLAADVSELETVFGGTPADSMMFTGEDGQWQKTGYAPVRQEGKVAGAVGVDGSVQFFAHLEALERTLWIAGAAALVLLLLVTLAISRGITRPLRRLAAAAVRIGGGDLSSAVSVESHDEIGLLAERLESMRRSLQERDAQMQMMLSGIAHEVRNPLGGMALFLGLLKEDAAGNTKLLESVARVEKELGNLAGVVNDFLEFARKRPLELEQVDLEALCRETAGLVESELQARQVKLRFDGEGPAPSLRLDGKRLRGVLLNVLRNAIQASPAGAEIVLGFRRRGDQAEIFVRDCGEGISPEVGQRVFEPFYTTRSQGTGLGLALARKVVEQHGGRIDFESRPGESTEFFIRLPAEKN